MNEPYVYLNGDIVPASDARLSCFDIGLLRGYAVFDLLRTIDGKPFLLAEHLTRLRASAAELSLNVPVSDDEVSAAIAELLRRNRHDEATVRMVLTGGVSRDGMTFDPREPTFFIMTHELHEPPAEVYEQGGKLVTHEHKREIPAAKTTNYLTMLQNRDKTVEAGALDLLYHDGECIYEAASASVYFVSDGTILAPKDDVLLGTIGSLVLDLAKDSYEIVFGAISIADAFAADEAFLTSTTRGIIPIVRIDDSMVGDGTPGPVTRELMDRYREATHAGS